MSQPERILVADDDRTIRRSLLKFLQAEGYATLEAADGDEALRVIKLESPDAVLLDLKMPGRDGLEVLGALGRTLGDLPVIVLTAFGGSAAAIEAMRRGAYDYLSKPFDLDEVLLTLKRALYQRSLAAEVRALRQQAEREDEADGEPELVGRGAPMREVFKAIGRAASTDEPVLIAGESGTGKELVASALHRHSRRASGPFLRVNCGALPEGLIESELFGHERGAFTGADRQRPGRFERATGGTIFLDEVAEIPLSAQAKLLRVLQSREFERVGGVETLRADARVVSATHRDLAKEVAAGRFREDLFYRLNVIRIALPPLHERAEDIPELAERILRRLERKYGWPGLSLSPEALTAIRSNPWPGNVRQLENALARAAIAARGRVILAEHLDVDAPASVPVSPDAVESAEPLPLRALLAEVERRAIQQALAATGGNRTRAAELLGISRRQLFDKVREYDLILPTERARRSPPEV
ncbi:MAG: sigma-54 dependent transcriptional regulator [Isosphaeraceae bacterium]|nr:sigma-54 dependent transcriptional regulator [Isosphaeraceae bacterium]